MLEWAKRILVSRGIPSVTDDGPCELSCPNVEVCELAEWTECERRITLARRSSLNAEDNGPDYTNDAVVQIGEATATPLPATLPLFASGLGAFGLLGWRRKRKAQAAA